MLAADPLTLWLMSPDDHDLPSLESLLARPTWQRRAACSEEPVETFVGDVGTTYGRARELCAGCPVRTECLAFALADADIVGYWGGTSTRERARMRRAAG
jgi:WhiB family transcriptional regulator, redox-sensing transcriptional regulator